MIERVWRATVHARTPQTLEIAGGTTRIGAASECEIVLDDPTIEPVHATLVRAGDELTVIDVAARQGVALDDVPLRKKSRASSSMAPSSASERS